MESEEIVDKGLEGENFVISLAEKSYLKYWCFSNPIDSTGDKKEICDLLILFDDTAIIISVKNYTVNGNYQRFLSKVVGKSSKQLFGAEKKLFKSKQIVLNHPLQGEVQFNAETYRHVYKITVSVGEDFENYDFIDYDDVKGTVNIFNRETFEILINELDTIKDLTEYLKLRENLLLSNNKLKCNCSEKDLVAYYLLNGRELHQELYNDFENFTKSLINKWNEYLENRSVFLKKLEDQKSYFIDKIVREDVLKLNNGEVLAKEFMTLSRFERRIIANNLFEIVEKYENEDDFLGRRFATYNKVGFLFIYYPIERSQKEINSILEKALQLYSYFHNSEKVVLLAASKGLKQWKFGLFQATEITPNAEEYLKKLAENMGWFKNEKRTEIQINEYPEK